MVSRLSALCVRSDYPFLGEGIYYETTRAE